MPLPLGIWTINVNGTQGRLEIKEVNILGILVGQMLDGILIEGFWNEVSQMVTFSTHVNQELEMLNVRESFKGYLFSTPQTPGPGQDILWTLAGSVLSTGGNSNIFSIKATARRNEFGWFAQLTQVV
jgi:hypothetical protein